MYSDAEKNMGKDLGPFLNKIAGRGTWRGYKKIKKSYAPKIKCQGQRIAGLYDLEKLVDHF
jgi:hypothetical protein